MGPGLRRDDEWIEPRHIRDLQSRARSVLAMTMSVELPALERTEAVAPPSAARLRRYARPALGLLLPVGARAGLGSLRSPSAISNGRLVPPPSRIFATVVELATSGELSRHIAATVTRVAAGFGLGVAAGTMLGAVVRLFGAGAAAARSDPAGAARDPVDRLGAAVHPVARHLRDVEDRADRGRRVLPGLSRRDGRDPVASTARSSRSAASSACRGPRWSAASCCRRCCRPMSSRCASGSASAGCSSSPPNSWARPRASAICWSTASRSASRRRSWPRSSLFAILGKTTDWLLGSPTAPLAALAGCVRPPERSGLMLAIENVGKTYPNGMHALERVTPRSSAGEIVAIVGGSGCGKSTLLRAVAGLDRADRRARSRSTTRVITAPHAKIGIIFQEPRLLPWLTVADNVGFGLSRPAGGSAARQVARALARVGLADKAKRWPRELSGGQAQRVAIARALVPAAGSAAARRAVLRARRFHAARPAGSSARPLGRHAADLDARHARRRRGRGAGRPRSSSCGRGRAGCSRRSGSTCRARATEVAILRKCEASRADLARPFARPQCAGCRPKNRAPAKRCGGDSGDNFPLNPAGKKNSRETKMDAAELRAMQAPIKERYKTDPSAAVITLKAKGSIDNEGIACKVETGRALAVAGLHPATGGSGLELCSGDMLLEALVACAGVTLKAVATAVDVPLEDRQRHRRGRSRFSRHARRRQGGPGRLSRTSACASRSTPTRRRTSSISC